MPSVKFGLGVPTRAMDWGWIGACSGGKATVTVKGDLALHAFQLDDYLVLSTSKGISRHIAAARAGASRPYPLPKVRGPLVGFGHIKGVFVGGVIDMMGEWVSRIAGDVTDAAEIRLIGHVARLVEDISWTTTGRRGSRIERGVVHFVD